MTCTIYLFDRLPDEPPERIFIVSVLDLIWLSHQGPPNRDYRASQEISYASKQRSFHASTCRVTLMNAEWLPVNVIFILIDLLTLPSQHQCVSIQLPSLTKSHGWVDFEERLATAGRMNCLNVGNLVSYCPPSHSSMLWHDKGPRWWSKNGGYHFRERNFSWPILKSFEAVHLLKEPHHSNVCHKLILN